MTGQLLAWISGGMIVAAFFLVWVAILIYNRAENPEIKARVAALLYMLDKQCDSLEVPAIRTQVILGLQQLLGWKRIFLPTLVVGFVLDIMVLIVRRMGCPDLHKREVGQDENLP